MKYVFVTGASGGTGFGICERFAKAGWGLILTSRNGEQAEEAAKKLTDNYAVFARGFELDIGDEARVKMIFDTMRSEEKLITALVLNAADLGMNQNAFDVDLNDWRRVLETNLVWNFSVMRAAALHMKDAGGGSIVAIGSNTARRAIDNRSAYIASKGGLCALCKALAIEWGDLNIRVNTLVSGSIKTVRWEAQTDEWRKIRQNRAPIGDIADYTDIANAAFFLSGDEARVITGTELIVDGGVDAQLVPREVR